jgi:6-phospho-beta-glucosidase
MKITIVGGGSTYTPELIDGLIAIADAVAFDEICLLDIPASIEKFNIVSAFAERMLIKAGHSARLHATLDAKQAFQNSDFIIFQFRAGLNQGRIQDELIPLEFGLIGQETTGMGGMACALRALPMIDDYVRLIEQFAPQAWIINFSNPSGLLSEYMINYLGYPRCIGLCNVPIEFIMESAKAFKGARDDVFLKYYGLNHLSWVDQVIVQGQDRTAEMWNRFKLNMKNIPQTDYEPDFLHKLQLLPNPYLRYFYMTDRMLASEMADRDGAGTRGQVIEKIEKELLQLYKDVNLSSKPEQLSQRGGYMYSTVATELIRDLVTNSGRVHIINTRNMGALQNLPDDYVMEIPATIHRTGPKSIPLGSGHKATLGLISTIKNFERLVIEGHIHKDEARIKQAMLIHPLGPKESVLEALWKRLRETHKDYFAPFAG